jgi:hypothetical protein
LLNLYADCLYGRQVPHRSPYGLPSNGSKVKRACDFPAGAAQSQCPRARADGLLENSNYKVIARNAEDFSMYCATRRIQDPSAPLYFTRLGALRNSRLQMPADTSSDRNHWDD